MIAIGIDSSSSENIKEFKIDDNDNDNDILHCYSEDLVSLEIPSGIKLVYCWNNK